MAERSAKAELYNRVHDLISKGEFVDDILNEHPWLCAARHSVKGTLLDVAQENGRLHTAYHLALMQLNGCNNLTKISDL